MGMFDTISVSDSLPYSDEMKELGLNINDSSFQTKDLENTLSQYYIQGGKLFLEKFKKEEWEQGDPNAKHYLDRIGRFKREEPYLDPVPYHGEIYFYDFKNNVQDKWDCWIEFKAVFSNGVVDRYELVKFEKTDNTERLEREKEWKEKFRIEQNKWYNRFFFHTGLYRWFAHRVWYRGFSKLSQVLGRVAFWL